MSIEEMYWLTVNESEAGGDLDDETCDILLQRLNDEIARRERER